MNQYDPTGYWNSAQSNMAQSNNPKTHLDLCHEAYLAALRREEGLANHNMLQQREISDLKQKYKVAVNALADKERELEGLKALYAR